MSMFWREKHTKRFLRELLCIACLGMTAAFLLIRGQESRVRGLLFEHDAAIAAALLEEGMAEQTVAKMMARAYGEDPERTEPAEEATALGEGERLLCRVGASKEADGQLWPMLHKNGMAGRAWTFGGMMLFLCALFLCVFRYLRKRDEIYREAIAAIENCGEENFSLKLPELGDGTLYQLFSRINFMAGMLKAKQEMENRAKEFLKETVADISHQLKTPLAALSLYLEIIRSEPGQADTVARFAEKSERTLARTEGLIRTLLKLARLDAGSVTFCKKNFDAEELALEAVGELTDRAKKEKKELLLSGEEGAKVCCDPEWSREALSNLIKNALDHTAEGDCIRVVWEQTPLMTRFTVADTGEGIAMEDIHHIFKRFYKSADSGDRQAAGLGLSLVKSIADGQGGTIAVQSEAGRETVFTLAFPNK